MDLHTTELPDDIDALKALVIAQALIVRERDAQLADLQQELSARTIEIDGLRLLIAKLRRMQFGRKSEKLDRQIEQLELRLEDLQADEASVAAAEPKKTRKRSEPTGRKPLPDHLEREERIYQPADEACPNCGGALTELGEDVAEQLEFIRAQFRVIRHRRPKKACSCCDCIMQAPAPTRPIDRGIPGPALLAHIAVSKFVDHLPLYRQSVIYARDGIDLDRSTMASWLGQLCVLVSPLVEALRRYVLAPGKVHADDTPVPVLAPGNGKTKTGRLWVYVRDDRSSGCANPAAVWFAYTPDRRGEHPQSHLANFSGVLQADAFAGYAELYRSGDIRQAACVAHARRRYYELHALRPSLITEEALRRIGALYRIEAEIRGKPPDERRQVRQAQAVPLLDDMKRWLQCTLRTLSGKSDTSKAIQYSLNRWEALTYYCDDGVAEIDNLPAERALRGVALGRRNYMFMGSDSGGDRAAAIYSLVGTARLNGLDPEAYLEHVFERIADHPINRINELLPWNCKSALPSSVVREPLR